MSFDLFPNHEHHYDLIARSGEYDQKINFPQRLGEIKQLLPALRPNSHVLDLACGTGVSIAALFQQTQKIKVVGVDFSVGMLKRAKDQFKSNKSLKLIKADFMQIDFPDNSFDLIIMSHATRYIPAGQEEKFANKIAGWLKPGGIFLAVLHRSPCDQIIDLLGYVVNPLTKLNISMTLESCFIRVMSKRLSLEKTIVIQEKNFLLKFIAVYLQKK